MSRFQLKTTQFDLAFNKLKLGNYDPIYFLMGEDQFLHSHFINELVNRLFIDETISKTFLIPDDMGSKEIMDQLITQDLFNSKKVFIFGGGEITYDEYKVIKKLHIPYEYFPVERKYKGDGSTRVKNTDSLKDKIGITYGKIK